MPPFLDVMTRGMWVVAMGLVLAGLSILLFP